MKKNNPFGIVSLDEGSLSLKGKYKEAWIEESFDMEQETAHFGISHTKNYIGSSISPGRIYYFLIIIGLGLFILFSRVLYLQGYRGAHFRGVAEGNRVRLIPVVAERGIMYDRFNNELVRNIPGFSLVIVPQDLPRDEAARDLVIKEIVELSGIAEEDIRATLKKYQSFSYESVTIKENLDYDTALELYIKHADLPGIHIESGSRRSYMGATPSSTPLFSLSHILGYVGKIHDDELSALRPKGYLLSDKLGKVGLEKFYESALRGSYGRKKIEVNAVGREQNVLDVELPVPGKNVILTLDLAAQSKLEELVKQTAEQTGKRKISAIALNPTNGEVLALVSWPAFDNNQFSKGIDQATYDTYITSPNFSLFNRSIAGTYPPGSTAKLMVAAAALEEKIAAKNTTVNSVGGIQVGGILFKDWKAGGHGITNVTRAIAWSVNTYFYYVGGGYENFLGLGVDRLSQYLKSFGVAEKTRIDIPGESAGFFPSKEWKRATKGEAWYAGDTYNLSIGQGDLLVTPLQVAVWTAAVANGGTVVVPHLVSQLVDPVSKQAEKLPFVGKKNNAVSSQNLSIVREGMRDCVTYGSCTLLSYLPFEAAGKTGTAQWSKSHPTHAWFTSFAPYRNPQIVVTVLVEEGGEGAAVSMPIAKQFLDWWGKKYLP